MSNSTNNSVSSHGPSGGEVGQKIEIMTYKIIWFGLLFGTGLYFALAYTHLNQAYPGEVFLDFPLLSFENPLVIGGSTAALFMLLLSVKVPGMVLQMSAKGARASGALDIHQKRRLFFAPFIIRLALIEGVALNGFIICYVADSNLGFALMAAAVMAFLATFPTDDKIQRAFDTLNQKSMAM
jgi:hypothetical protein